MNPNIFRTLSEFLRHPGLLVPVQRDLSLTFLFISYRPFLDLSMPHLLSPTDGHIEIASGLLFQRFGANRLIPNFRDLLTKNGHNNPPVPVERGTAYVDRALH